MLIQSRRGMKPRAVNNFLSNDRFFREKSDTPPFRAVNISDTNKMAVDPAIK